MELLALPESILHPNDLQKVLMGMFVIGPDIRAYKRLRRIQRARQGDFDLFWPDDDRIRSARKILDGILVEDMEWVNTRFHPDDRMNALLLDPFIDLSMAIALIEVERHFPEAKSADFGCFDITYLEFVRKCLGDRPFTRHP